VLKETAPGKSWTGSNNGVRSEQRTNRKEEDVKIWGVAAAPGSIPTKSGEYKEGDLFVMVTTNEQENKTIEYKNKDGLIILKKVQATNILQETYTGWLSTYYIYDDLNQLRWVLQPKGVEYLIANSWSLSNVTVQNEQCFRYEYDARGRMIIKKILGAGEVWMVYDKRDQLIMTQDADQRASAVKKWLVMRDVVHKSLFYMSWYCVW
jgi:hypothetical protein